MDELHRVRAKLREAADDLDQRLQLLRKIVGTIFGRVAEKQVDDFFNR